MTDLHDPVTPPVDPAAAPSAAPDVSPTPAPSPAPEPRNEAPRWALERISQESGRAREAQERFEAAERRAKEAEALVESIRRQQTPPDHNPPSAAPPLRDDRGRYQSQDDLRAQMRAEILAESERSSFYNDTRAVQVAGHQAFGDAFQSAVGAVEAYAGRNFNDLTADIIAVDKGNAHKIFHALAQSPEKAMAIAAMPSRQRVAELTRMSMANPVPVGDPAKPAPGVSKAPPPAPIVQPTERQEADWRSDKATDKQFSDGFDAMFERKYGRKPLSAMR